MKKKLSAYYPEKSFYHYLWRRRRIDRKLGDRYAARGMHKEAARHYRLAADMLRAIRAVGPQNVREFIFWEKHGEDVYCHNSTTGHKWVDTGCPWYYQGRALALSLLMVDEYTMTVYWMHIYADTRRNAYRLRNAATIYGQRNAHKTAAKYFQLARVALFHVKHIERN